MKPIKYELLSKSPIKITVDANSTSAAICWAYRLILQRDTCDTCAIKSNQCKTIILNPNDDCNNPKVTKGSFTWYGIRISYEITQRKKNCSCDGKKTTRKELIRSWVSPYDFYCNQENKNATLWYEYNVITEQCGKVIKKETKKNKKPITIDCDCADESRIVKGQTTVEEGFNIAYSANCIVDVVCECGSFDFIEDECQCGDFDFIKGECVCDDFDFIDADCNCGDFDFTDVECNCNNLEIKQ
jgi:hypothetical protein